MSDLDSKQSELNYLDPIAKAIGLVAGLLYLCGFVIVAGHLSRYGVSGFSVIQLQYLIAGSWALLPLVAGMLVQEARAKFDHRTSPEVIGKFNWRRFWISTVLSGLPFTWLMVLLVASGVPLQMRWWSGVKYYLFYLALYFLTWVSWNSWKTPEQNNNNKKNVFFHRDTSSFYLSLLLVVVCWFTVWFSKNIYPLIPYSWGGGKPLTVVFVLGEKKLPDTLKLDPSSKRTLPYRLLTTTDKYYVVLSQEPSQLSIELSRDYVAEMVVLAEPKEH